MSQPMLSDYSPMNALQARAGDYAMSIPEAARALGLSVRTALRRVKAGDIHSVRVSPRRRVVLASEVARVLTEGM